MTTDFRPLEPMLKGLLDSLSTAEENYDKAVARTERYATSLVNDPEFGVVDARIGGSIGKGTAISPLSDVDLYVYLDAQWWTTTRGKLPLPSTVIGRLRARVEQRLQFELGRGHASVRPQNHSVGIRFRKADSVGIDVVPALVRGGDTTVAFIPRRGTSTFVETSVERQLSLIAEMDSPFRYLRRGIRLLKFWNRQADVRLHSYTVEVLGMHAVHRGCKRTEAGVLFSALEFMQGTRMRTPVFVPRFFNYSPPGRRACLIYDPAMPDNNLGASLDAAAGDRLATAAGRALTRATKAAEAAVAGRHAASARLLSEAFGQAGLVKQVGSR